MAKLYFRYGTVCSAKTLNLLAVCHNYKKQGKNVIVLKPKIDTRMGNLVYSRTGMRIEADYQIDDKSDLLSYVSTLVSNDKLIDNSNNYVIRDQSNNDLININDDLKHSLNKLENNIDNIKKELHCILVDEAQFLNKDQIMQLRFVATYLNVPVICYGLRTNYLGELFSGSQALFCYADSIEEIKNTCQYCNKKAILNLRIKSNGTNDGSIDLGFEDKYVPTCFQHYFSYVE